LWGLTGLLYNIDHEYVGKEPEKSGNLAAQLLDGLLPEAGINAIKSINYMHTNYIPITSLDKSLIAADAVTDLIFKIMHSSSKKLSDLDLDVLVDKLNDPSRVSINERNRIKLCNDIGMDVEVFLALSLNFVKQIPDDLCL
jgi:predicted hydrolase (HD superfamily)